jgi:hypothetical protein
MTKILWKNREPSPEDLAVRAEADCQAAIEARAEAVRAALAREADPLFFQYQRDEVSREDWLAKVAEVKARWPKPERQA